MRKFLVGLIAAAGLAFATPSAEAYIHIDAAQNYCRAWNNQSAVDNIRYVEATLGRTPFPIGNAYYPGERYGNNDVRVTIQWHETANYSANNLAIDYACRIQGTDDAHMYPVGIAGSAVYWIYN